MGMDLGNLRNSRLWRFVSPFKHVLISLFEYKRLKEIYGSDVAWANTYSFRRSAKSYVTELIEHQTDDVYNGDDILFSILVPVYNTPVRYLKETIETVLAQTYKNFELILSDVSDEAHVEVGELCRKYEEYDKRIKYIKHEERLNIARNTNEALKQARGDYVALLDHDDKLMLNALSECARAIKETKGDVFYSDEYSFKKDDTLRVDRFFFKNDFCIYEARALNYICHFLVIKRSLMQDVKGEREGFDGAQDHDLILRLYHKGAKIVHIPKLLYRWRVHAGSTASGVGQKNYASLSGKRAVEDELKKANIMAFVSVTDSFPTVYRVEYGAKIGTSVKWIYLTKEMELDDIISMVTEENADIIALAKEDLELDPDGQQELKSISSRMDVGCAGGMIIDPEGQIISNGIEYKDQKNIFVTLSDRGDLSTQSAYNRRLFYARSVDEVEGLMFIRKGVFLECIKRNAAGDPFQVICRELKKKGYLVISDPYAKVIKK